MWVRTSILLFAMAVLAIPACSAQRPVESIRERADFFFARGEYGLASEEYAQITARYPGDWRAQHRLGVSLLEQGSLTGARRALELAHSQRPGDIEIVDALAETMFRQGDERQLYDLLRERAESTQSPEAYSKLGHYALELGDPDSARLAFDTAIVLDDGTRVEPYLDSATFAEHIGDIELAVRRLRQAYSINPHDARVTSRLRDLGEVPGPTIALPTGR